MATTFKQAYKTMKNKQPTYKTKTFKGNYKTTTYKSDYTPTDYTDTYSPEQYQSKYTPQIESALNNVTNWSYDPLQDASYQALAKVYGARGNIAAKNSLADAAALNGGYGTSYAVSAAQQARNQYNQELASYIPQLEQNAYERQQTGLNALMDIDNSMYGRFSDDQSRQLQAKQFGLDVAGYNEGNKQFAANLGLDYNKLNQSEKQFLANYNLDKYQVNQNERQFAFGSKADSVNNSIGNALSYLNYLQSKKANSGGGHGGGGSRSSGGGGGGYVATESNSLADQYKKAQEEAKKKAKNTKGTGGGGGKTHKTQQTK